MEQKLLIYLDQNLLQYDFEGKIRILKDQDIQWVFSEEHFNEISRNESEREQYFNVLNRLKARKLKLKMDGNFKLTNECELLEYSDPKLLYENYLQTIDDYKDTMTFFNPLQTFFFGNKSALDIDSFPLNFKNIISGLTEGIGGLDKNEQFLSAVESIGSHLGNGLESAKDNIQPLDKVRKQLTKDQLSNIKDDNGDIIDQIWNKVGKSLLPMTKDQFFGKEIVPQRSNDTSDKKQKLFLGIVQCHTALNFLGYWPDAGLPKESKLFGINSDASHIAHGFFCSGIISADDRLCKKARAIYQYFGKTGGVYKVELTATNK